MVGVRVCVDVYMLPRCMLYAGQTRVYGGTVYRPAVHSIQILK